MVWTNFNKLWSNLFHKEHATLVKNGKTAIFYALKHLNSKKVALPTYTCERVLQACLLAKVEPYIIDCNKNLQINLDTIPTEVDTVIIPHMFGIQSKIPKNKTYKIIEDCSQCIGLKDLGKYSDIVIASTGPTKWLNAGGDKENGGGIIAYNGIKNIPQYNESIAYKLNQLYFEVPQRLYNRQNKANELINAGIDLIGKNQPNSWLRAMYFGPQKRIPYTPLHDLYPGFNCPIVDSYKNKLDWISIFP
jgi:hypothetical protein